MKIDAIDKKILSTLYSDCRKTTTQIAKICKTSRDQAEYRIKKFEKSGLIKKYLTLFNYDKLAIGEFIIVWFKAKKPRALRKEIEGMDNNVSAGDSLGKYNLFANFMFKDKQEFETGLNRLLNRFKGEIQDYQIFFSTNIELYPLKSVGINKENGIPIVEKNDEAKITEKDIQIIKELEKNARARIIDISEKTKISSELIVYRLRQLKKRQIITGTRIEFDLEKLGMFLATLKLNLSDISQKEKLKTFCKNHKNINAFSFGISNFNCLIQIFYKEEAELRSTIKEIENYLQEKIKSSELLLIENESKAKTLPTNVNYPGLKSGA